MVIRRVAFVHMLSQTVKNRPLPRHLQYQLNNVVCPGVISDDRKDDQVLCCPHTEIAHLSTRQGQISLHLVVILETVLRLHVQCELAILVDSGEDVGIVDVVHRIFSSESKQTLHFDDLFLANEATRQLEELSQMPEAVTELPVCNSFMIAPPLYGT